MYKKIVALFLSLIAAVTAQAATVTVPINAQVEVGLVGTAYVPYDIAEIADSSQNGDSTTYTYALEEGKSYNYRVKGEEYVTYSGFLTDSEDITVTEEQLKPEGKTKTTAEEDVTLNGGYNVGDIYLNINPQGHLKLANAGDTYQIIPLRNHQIIESMTGSKFVKPDFHYTVTDENVISIDENGLITALNEGETVVQVTYDAITAKDVMGEGFFGALWQENIGVFVVTVGDCGNITMNTTLNKGLNSSELKLSGENIDAEHDVIYFTGDTGEYTFTPDADGVFAATQQNLSFTEILKNADGSFTVPLENGRNIIKAVKGEAKAYQIITAKKVDITVNNGEAVQKGDRVEIVFNRLYHPAGKLTGIYNMTAIPVYMKNSAYSDRLIGSVPAQVNFASNADTQKICNFIEETSGMWGEVNYSIAGDFTVPLDYDKDVLTLSQGVIYITGWGDSYGNHRNITLENGKAPNFNSDVKNAKLCKLPDIEIPIKATDALISGITADYSRAKTMYYEGEAFDCENLIITACYEDGVTQQATDYEISPAVLRETDTAVTVTYRGVTTQIPVTVIPLAVTAVSVTKQPDKVNYREGETFNPTGMEVTATYNDGISRIITEYTYSPNRILQSGDSEITITYSGGNVPAVTVPITVTAGSIGDSGTANNNITVYFTLYGDSKHGDSAVKHTMKSGNLTLWLTKTAVSVPKNSTVAYAAEKALSIAGIPYSNSTGDYFERIKNLSAFDNGAMSGWMYTLNGNYPDVGISGATLKNGDKIVFHYTDDFNAEYTEVVSGSGGNYTAKTDKKEIDALLTEKYLLETVKSPEIAMTGGEWTVIGLARGGELTEKEYFEKYLENAGNRLKECDGVLHDRKHTEYSRVILALTALGENPEAFCGYNIVEYLEDYDATTAQGINGAIWALLALDSGDYETAEGLRDKYVNFLLENQLESGGFPITPSLKTEDIDVTAMAISALAEYGEAADAVQKALTFLESKENSFKSAENYAQTLVAMTALRVERNDSRYENLLNKLKEFQNTDGSYKHLKTEKTSSLMATEQVFYAMAAVKRLEENKTWIFDMSDVEKKTQNMPKFGLIGKHKDIKEKKTKVIGKTFGDIKDSKVKEKIEALASREIINGKNDTVFDPNGKVTRAEFAAMVVRALGLERDVAGVFDDVTEDSWYFKSVNTAVFYGIVKGISDREFNPEGTITRQEAAVMSARAAKLCGHNTELSAAAVRDILAAFTDYTGVAEWAKEAMAFCFNTKIKDDSEMEILPQTAVTREEIADMLYNLMEKSNLLQEVV